MDKIMKLVNSKNINKMTGNPLGDFYDLQDEEEYISPCWEVKVDKERGDMIFLVDGNEKLAYSLDKLDNSFLTIEKISELIKIFKTGELKELRKELKKKHA